mgnify:CR=1 FL=1
MKRDLELIRALCLALEAAEGGTDVESKLVESGYTPEQIGFHVYLLGDAGLAVVHDATALSDHLPRALAAHLTWRGYEFLEVAREDKRWSKAKAVLTKARGASLEVALELLKSYLKHEAGLP